MAYVLEIIIDDEENKYHHSSISVFAYGVLFKGGIYKI
jgi:hypothetical protein